MDLRDMRYFLAVAEEGHMGRAANRLHLSQPPLTRHIQALEEKLGVPLFLRTPKGMALTEAGLTLLQEVPNLLELAQQAAERTRLAGQGWIGRLDVGLFGSGVLDVIPRILAQFHQARPDVKIVLHNLTKDAQLQALRERRITVGFNRLVPAAPDISTMTVLRESLMVALPAVHPLSVLPSLRIRDLANVPLILYPNVPMRGLAQEVSEQAAMTVRANARMRVSGKVVNLRPQHGLRQGARLPLAFPIRHDARPPCCCTSATAEREKKALHRVLTVLKNLV